MLNSFDTLPTEFINITPEFGELVCQVLKSSHWLSKRLAGRRLEEVFRMRADLTSILVLAGIAQPNGIHADGTVGLDVFCQTPFRVHQPLGELTDGARRRVRAVVGSLRATCALREHLEAKGQTFSRDKRDGAIDPRKGEEDGDE